MSPIQSPPYFSSWPEIHSSIPRDAKIEQEIARILDLMTLEEKLGQMIQPNLRDVTPEEAKKYKLGSLLNGGGTWVNDDKYSKPLDWALESDKFWNALEDAYRDRPFKIPFMWASDAVHGHNNIFGATLFPHNIGLGAAQDPDLIFKIGRATALEVATTGMDWTFAPTVATPRNLRWGRTYEGYSEDPAIVYAYASKMVEGLQGTATELKGYDHVLANVKHWVGDGGTLDGIDRGNNAYTEEQLINIHAVGYFSGLAAGAQVVMSSFSGWTSEQNYALNDNLNREQQFNKKLSGSHYLLTKVLKEQMGFDGAIISDWNSHAEITACDDGNANYCINAGLDILMVTARADWQSVIENAIKGVETGEIAQSRIDDAVTRILRIKMRAGLWDKPKPSQRKHAGNNALFGAQAHRDLAREAVRKSLVLLKNNQQILPLSRNSKVLLAGSAMNDIQKMTGGWSLTWQGADTTEADFPGCTTLQSAISQVVSDANAITLASIDEIDNHNDVDTVIVAIGEDPYAEIMGDIKMWQSLSYASLKRSYAKDLELIKALKEKGKRVVTLFFSGRPLYVNEEINQSDAFIAAWLPGTEGQGITDVLFKNADEKTNFNFSGKLSFSWPMKKQAFAVNASVSHIPNYTVPEQEQDPRGEFAPLFELGYGLEYPEAETNRSNNQLASSKVHSEVVDLDTIPLDIDDDESNNDVAKQSLPLFGVDATGDYQLKMADHNNWLTGLNVSGNNATRSAGVETSPIDYVHQQDGRRINFTDSDAMIYVQTIDQQPESLLPYLNANADLVFAVKVIALPDSDIQLAPHKDMPALPTLNITDDFQQLEKGSWQHLRIPLKRFEEIGCDFNHVDTPFMLMSKGGLEIELGAINLEVPVEEKTA